MTPVDRADDQTPSEHRVTGDPSVALTRAACTLTTRDGRARAKPLGARIAP